MGKISDCINDLIDDVSIGRKSPVKRMSPAAIIALSFLVIIMLGTVLLSLPVASKVTPPSFLDAMFTAVSATCVTGLVVFDTFTQWSLFGQIVIICMIQIGGMGLMTIVSLFSIAVGRKIGLKERSILQESVNNSQLGGIVKLMRTIAVGTFAIEGIGALLLSFRFVPELGIGKGIYKAVFMSVSAFCNAGFDLNGSYREYSSLSQYYNDPLVVIVIAVLIIIGSIGFAVWDDIGKKKLRFSAYRLHSKIVISMTLILTVAGTVLFYVFERNATAADMTVGEQMLNAFFNSVSPRSGGFNTVDTSELSPASTVLTIIYMIIGGSPGSTAGGAKTTTVAVLFFTAVANMRNSDDINIFGRRLEEDVSAKALTVLIVNITLTLSAILLITVVQPQLALNDVVFECFSAQNTMGMSTGVTRDLNSVSRIIIMILMYCGRVGSVSFAILFTRNKSYSGVRNLSETVNIG